MKIIVTGGAGFIGSHIVDHLIGRGHDVAVVDDLSSGMVSNLHPKARFFRVDITNADSLRIVFAQFSPEAVSHQAAQPSLRRSIEYPASDAEINILGTLNVIEACRYFEVKHIVFASTSAVYDTERAGPYTESSDIRPTVPYGIAKTACERYLRALMPEKYTILRYGNVYGPRQVPVGENQLVPRCLGHILNDEEFVINGHGKQARDFIFVTDIARANVLALENKLRGTFNAGTGVATSVNDVVSHIAAMTGFAAQFVRGPAKDGEPYYVCLDSRKLSAHRWQAETSLIEGLRMTAEAAKANHENMPVPAILRA